MSSPHSVLMSERYKYLVGGGRSGTRHSVPDNVEFNFSVNTEFKCFFFPDMKAHGDKKVKGTLKGSFDG